MLEKIYWRYRKSNVHDVYRGRLKLVAEESAYQMVSETTVDRTNAIQKIMDGIYTHNREHANVISSICSLFIELSHYGQTLVKFITHHLRVYFHILYIKLTGTQIQEKITIIITISTSTSL